MAHSPLIFDITKAPPTAEDIQAEIAYQKRRLWWFSLFGVIPSILFSYLLDLALVEFGFILAIPIHQDSGERIVVLSVIMTILVFCHNYEIFDQDKRRLTRLDLQWCGKALALVKEYPEIDVYRLAVVKQRTLTNADLEAIGRFPEEHEQRMATAKLQHDFDALHKPEATINDGPNCETLPANETIRNDNEYRRKSRISQFV